MPKKFKGENTKAQDARARKAAAKETAEEKRKQEEEDTAWRDDDKHVSKKQDRKSQKESRRVEQLERKLANQKLLDEEEQTQKGLAKGGGDSATKVTHAQIQESRERERREEEKQEATGGGGPLREPQPLELNPNLLELERQRSGEVQARTVEEAIAVLGGVTGKVSGEDKHPEKRMKAAFQAFEEREMSRLKAENPTLRMSQLRQLLKKEWMKSPENPMFQGGARGRGT